MVGQPGPLELVPDRQLRPERGRPGKSDPLAQTAARRHPPGQGLRRPDLSGQRQHPPERIRRLRQQPLPDPGQSGPDNAVRLSRHHHLRLQPAG
ncbi:hypothetical protein G6F63_013646 [Rhizopus arrhizus]|nr:hypothetical protein G6F32_015490 [Rhizopus arrhizus]KAG1321778.1 hypothetical protein G6F63_013646 [Rhizopus arrhizus]